MRPWLSAALAFVLAVAVGLAVARWGAGVPVAGSSEESVATPDSAPTPTPPPTPNRPSHAARGVPADAERVRIRWVSDGDTVTLRAVRRGVLPVGEDVAVRLLEIDTPESKRRGVAVECLARAATAVTERLLPRGSVAWVQTDRERHDRYGRTLGYVWNARGAFVNEVLVRRGLAVVAYFPPNDRHLDRMRAAESEARAAGRGLWSRC